MPGTETTDCPTALLPISRSTVLALDGMRVELTDGEAEHKVTGLDEEPIGELVRTMAAGKIVWLVCHRGVLHHVEHSTAEQAFRALHAAEEAR